MKIHPVSLSFKSAFESGNIDSNFMYYKKEPKYNRKDLVNGYKFLTGFAATTAVIIALFNIGKKKRFPDSIIELTDNTKGLNNIKDQSKIVELIKSKFIYPIKAFIMGDKNIGNDKCFKSGLVITGENSEKLSKLNDAICEHLSELNINVISINAYVQSIKDGEKVTYKRTKSQVAKQIYNAFEKAKEEYMQTGKFTLINLGDMDNVTSMRIVKSKKSNIDNLIAGINQTDSPGVIWTGWTTKKKSLPLFFSELPVIVSKLES